MGPAAHREESNTARSDVPTGHADVVTRGDGTLHTLRPVRGDRGSPPVWARALRGTWRLRWLVLSTARSGHTGTGSAEPEQVGATVRGGATVQPIRRPLVEPVVRTGRVQRRPRPDRGAEPR